MCGIAGFIEAQRGDDSAERLITRMCRVIHHRGPDDQGTWSGDGAALGATRLAIIDLTGGHQPIFNEDRNILTVFNGEIYNQQELTRGLQARGHHFSTKCDTELVVHAYEEYGADCPRHLRGMFAFAIWDRTRQRLFLARDRFGKKPLNYYWDGRRFIFASEIKAILEAGIPREVDAVAMDEYLVYGYVPAPRTIFKNVLKLPAAHTLTLERGTLALRRYWELSFTPTCHDDEEVALERTRELIKDAVKVRLMSDVPLGAFLSGGVDSSVVVGFMSQMLSRPVKTFSIGFREAEFNELPYARRVAEYVGADHHELMVGPDLVPSILPELVWAYDEPFGDSSMLPTYYVSKLAREHVTVALSGDGGDEMFAGYTHYRRERMISRIPWLARQALGIGSRLMLDGMRGKRRLRNLSEALPLRYVQGMMLPRLGTRAGLYTPDHLASLDGHDPYARQTIEFAAVESLDVVTQMQYVDARNYLVDDILVKVDKASMFTSLETRMPLLDQHLVEYVASLQPSFRMPGGSLKYLLKRVAAELVPREILTRTKQGFGAPVEHWIRKELAEYTRAMLQSGRARQRGIFDPEFLSRLLDAHSRGRWVNHSRTIWSLLCLEVWFQTYLDNSVRPGAHARM